MHPRDRHSPTLHLVPAPAPERRRPSPRARAVLILGAASVVFSFLTAGLVLGLAGFLISAPAARGPRGPMLTGRILCVAGCVISTAVLGLRLGT
ncbi:hypothetical protein [Actinoplanes sp. RD1]|uniref:hypothetical protein n=1 Tax=Actinoplanes sp. RD1 TaxID=3064538 RepID=UPI00274080B4|nr:hypothetical protein [Actinoplanes sp. RD1]